jgi:hypothetical protein
MPESVQNASQLDGTYLYLLEKNCQHRPSQENFTLAMTNFKSFVRPVYEYDRADCGGKRAKRDAPDYYLEHKIFILCCLGIHDILAIKVLSHLIGLLLFAMEKRTGFGQKFRFVLGTPGA